MQHEDIVLYCDRMNDIKSRIDSVRYLLAYPAPLHRDICIEMVYLQYRKILEQIAFGSLISNKEKFSKAQKRFSKYWNAADLFRDLERVNKNFYPQPIIEQRETKPGVTAEWIPKTGGFLTKSDFLELYGRSGDILHERNPYAGPQSLDWFFVGAAEWAAKIVQLVTSHTIRLYDDPNLYLVHLEPRGFVHYKFAPVTNPLEKPH